MASSTLEELSKSDIQHLLNELEAEFPRSIHVISFVSMIIKWTNAGRGYTGKILALNGDVNSKCIVAFLRTPNSENGCTQFIVHKWTHRTDDAAIFSKALENSKDLFFSNSSPLKTTAVSEESVEIVKPFMARIWDNVDPTNSPGQHLCWLPSEEAVKLSVTVPQGCHIAHLSEQHAEEIDRIWPHRYAGSVRIIRDTIFVNFGIGLFDSTTNELMSWAVQAFYGGIGLLQTKEKYRRKGYGLIVLRAISKELALKGYRVHLNVRSENKASLALVEKCGFRLAYRSTWFP